MIATITINPALDKSLVVEKLIPEKKLRYDLKNWENFGSWKQDDPKMKFIFSKKTIGKGSYYSWKGQDGEGKMTTIFVKSNDSIHQKMSFNDAESNVYWNFNETNGKTKVTWRNIGKMDFTTIIFTTLFGGMDQIIGNMYEKSLINIENNLKNKVNTHSVIADGFIEITMGMYLQKTINSSNENLENNIQIMIPNILRFTQKNKISISGKPFVKYNSSNDLKGTTNFSVCISIKDSIITSKSNEYTFDKMLPFQAMKATLTGDLSFKNKAKIKALELITENNLIQKTELPIIEIYKNNKTDSKNANKWITEIYVPVKKKDYIKKYVKQLIKNKISTKITPTATPNPVSNIPIPEKIIIRKDFPQ